MNKYKITFTIDGHRTEQIVSANSISEARKIIEAQYSGCSIKFISTGHEYI